MDYETEFYQIVGNRQSGLPIKHGLGPDGQPFDAVVVDTPPGEVFDVTGGITGAEPEALPAEVTAGAPAEVSVGEFAKRGLGNYAMGIKGIAQAWVGIGGDMERLITGLIKAAEASASNKNVWDAFLMGVGKDSTLLWTTDDAKLILDKFISMLGVDAKLQKEFGVEHFQERFMLREGGVGPMPVGMDGSVSERFGEWFAPGGQLKAAVKLGKALRAGLQRLPESVRPGPMSAGLSIQPVTGEQAAAMIAAKQGTETAAPVAEGVVSTRFPTAKKATENPLEQNLVIGLDAAKSDPAAFAHNVGMASKYPNFVSKATTPDAQAEDFINHIKDNLLFLHDSVPEATRVRSKLWYDGARNIATRYASEYNIPDTGVAGIMAVLSPQKDWFMNVSLGTRVLDILTKQQSHVWDAAMTQKAAEIWAKPQYAPMVKALQGKSLNDIQDPGLRAMWLRTFDEAYLPREHQIISPEGDFVGVRTTQKGAPMKTGWGSLNEIGKAVAIFDNPGVANISTNLGTQHKVRNFYNNIFAPNDPGGHVTIDTHAVAAGLLRPLSGKSREVIHNFGSGIVGEGGTKNSAITGVQGTYPLYAEAYRRAAAERGILPREMQSITWEAVRGLFPDTYKTAQNTAQIDNIWLKYKQGKISLEEARNEVTTAAGGINPPEWERAGLRRESAPAIQTAGNQGELPGAGVPGRRAGRPRRVKPAGGNQAGVNIQQGGTE